ncbi:MAG: hypothetical protein U5R31_05610 [Acidimicrobiia bacterium]|nr:hypothetical protein [Acidimicrobiia bacterium]
MAADGGEVDGLVEVAAWAASRVLVDQAARVTRLIQVHTDEVPPQPDVVRELGRLLAGL